MRYGNLLGKGGYEKIPFLNKGENRKLNNADNIVKRLIIPSTMNKN